jgi:hypothetical protein
MDTKMTDNMILALRAEAGAAGDVDLIAMCDRALEGVVSSRLTCAKAITEARAMCDDDGPFVRVVTTDDADG